jgi:hypothetical protein
MQERKKENEYRDVIEFLLLFELLASFERDIPFV